MSRDWSFGVLSGALLLIAVATLYGIAAVSKYAQGRLPFMCFYR